MIGIVVGVLLSWGLLRLAGRPLADLWRGSAGYNARLLGGGIVIAGALALTLNLTLAKSAGGQITVNPDVSPGLLAAGAWFVLKSVAFEELLFRGALLLLALRWLGERPAVMLSAAAFGVYHWFSYGLLGQPLPMAYVFALTAVTGWVWALAYARSGSMALPLGLHLGWNVVVIVVLSQGPLGPQWLLVSETRPLGLPLWGVFTLLQVVVVPVLMLFFALRLIGRGARPSPVAEPDQP